MRRMALARPDRLVVVERDNTGTVSPSSARAGTLLGPTAPGPVVRSRRSEIGDRSGKALYRRLARERSSCSDLRRSRMGGTGEVSGVTAPTSNVVRGSALGTALDGTRP